MRKAQPTAYSYIRFSTPTQAAGDSLRRQTEAAERWCERNGARLDTATTLHDLGKSAYTGAHRKNPDRHALAAFLKLVEQERVPRGSVLIVESLDRLSREHIRPALSLLLNLIESGIRVVQLIPVEAVYDDKVEPMQLMMALMELSRGNSESRVKSERVGAAWSNRRKRTRENGEVMTKRLPAWVECHDGKLRLIPDRAKTVKRIFELAAGGYGLATMVKKLTADGVKPFAEVRGRYGRHWTRAYLGLILRDRRALGECQPHTRHGTDGRRTATGEPVKGYFPAVVTEAEWLAARAGSAARGRLPGRNGEYVNPFQGLLKNARDGESYYCDTRTENGVRSRVLRNVSAAEGRAPCVSFPYPTFEAAILRHLRELDPRELLGTDDGPDEVMVLSGDLAAEETKIAELEAELENGDVAALARKLREREARKAELVRELAEARQRAANPLSESWGEAQTLAGALASAPDQADARLRLRSALRRIVESVWCLFVPRGRGRLAAVQVWFRGGANREYLIYHQSAHGTGRPASWRSWSLTDKVPGLRLDLRRPDHALALGKLLGTIDPAKLD